MGGVDDELGDEVLFAGLHAEAAGASATLLAVDGDGGALEVAGVGDGYGDLLVGDEVFELELGGLVDDLGAAGVAVLVADLGELFDDEFAEFGRRGEDGLELGDVVADFGQLFESLVDGELGEAVELQFEDGVDLPVAEDEGAGGRESHVDAVFGGVEGDALELGAAEVDLLAGEVLEEILAGFGAAAGLTDGADDVVEVIERDLVAEEGVLAVAGLAEEEGSAAADDFDAVIEEGADGGVERELLGLTVVDGQEDHGEGVLHLGVLVELVEDDLVLGAALEADVDAHAVAVGFVAELVAGDVGDDALVDEVGDAFDEPGFVDLVGDLGDDDGLTSAGDVFDGALGAHDEAATAGTVGVGDAGLAEDEAAGGEVRAFDMLEADVEVGAGVRLFFGDKGDAGVDDFGEIVGRNVGRHAHRNASRAVDDEVGDARGEDGGFGGGLVVVGGEVYGVGVDVGEHFAGDASEAGLGVSHGGRWVAVDGAEVALAVYEGVAEAEGLGEADHGVVDGGVAVGVEVAHDVADDLGGLGELLVELEAHLLHAVEDATVDGFEAVTDVGQGSADDDRHRVVEVGAAHLLFNIDGIEEGGASAADVVSRGAVGGTAGGRGVVGVGVLGGGDFGVFRILGEEIVSHDLYPYYKGFGCADGGVLEGGKIGRKGRAEAQKGCSEEHPFCLVDVGLEGELEVQLHRTSVVLELLLRVIEEGSSTGRLERVGRCVAGRVDVVNGSRDVLSVIEDVEGPSTERQRVVFEDRYPLQQRNVEIVDRTDGKRITF